MMADEHRTIRVGGYSLILGALAFMAVFTFLAIRFNDLVARS
jgi:hypothetical protein